MFDDLEELLEEEFTKDELEVLNCEHENTFIRGWNRSETVNLIFRKIKGLISGDKPLYPQELLIICRNEEERVYLKEHLFRICGADEITEKIEFRVFDEFIEDYAPKNKETGKRGLKQLSLKRDKKTVFMIDPPKNYKNSENFMKLMSRLFPRGGAVLFFWEYENFLDPLSIKLEFPESSIITLESGNIRRVNVRTPKPTREIRRETIEEPVTPMFAVSDDNTKPRNISPQLFNVKKGQFMNKEEVDYDQEPQKTKVFIPNSRTEVTPPKRPKVFIPNNRIETPVPKRPRTTSPQLFNVQKSEFMNKQELNYDQKPKKAKVFIPNSRTETQVPRRAKSISPQLFNVQKREFMQKDIEEPRDLKVKKAKVFVPSPTRETPKRKRKNISPLLFDVQKKEFMHREGGNYGNNPRDAASPKLFDSMKRESIYKKYSASPDIKNNLEEVGEKRTAYPVEGIRPRKEEYGDFSLKLGKKRNGRKVPLSNRMKGAILVFIFSLIIIIVLSVQG